MSGFRFEAEAFAGPDREGLVGGGAQLLVVVRLFDGPGVVDHTSAKPTGQPDAYTDLRPADARRLRWRCCRPPRTPTGKRSHPTGARRRRDQ